MHALAQFWNLKEQQISTRCAIFKQEPGHSKMCQLMRQHRSSFIRPFKFVMVIALWHCEVITI